MRFKNRAMEKFTEYSQMEQVQINRDKALKLARDVIATLDQEPLGLYVDAMMTEGYKQAIAFSAVSGDKPDNFDLFMAMCESNGFLSENETIDLCLQLVRKSRPTPLELVQGKSDCDQDQEQANEYDSSLIYQSVWIVSSDPYLYTGTTVLRNHFGIRNQDELDRLERTKISRAFDFIIDKLVSGNFDYAHLCEIHFRIFEEVYPFAGKTRIINISKYEPVLNESSVDYSKFMDIFRDATKHLKNMNKRDGPACMI